MLTDLTSTHWRDYELLDCGNGQKLEKFGPVILIRPEPEAIWPSDLPLSDWEGMASAIFRHDSSGKGKWSVSDQEKKSWRVQYGEPAFKISCEVKLGRHKNIGLFPEQAPQWQYIHEAVKSIGKKPKVLNLFAHTGLSGIVAAKAGADVYHVEGVKQFVNWARENAELNKVSNIHWVLEDVIKFLKREQKRGHTYDGIIADPPAFGTGPGKEKWVLDKHLPLLMGSINNLLTPEKHFMVLNSYGSFLAPNSLYTLSDKMISGKHKAESGTLSLTGSRGHKITMGTFVRLKNY